MDEIQILLGIGAIAALILCLLSSLFYQQWPNRFWKTLVLFWGAISATGFVVVILAAIIPGLGPWLSSSESVQIWWISTGGSIGGFWQYWEQQRQQQQRCHSAAPSFRLSGGVSQMVTPAHHRPPRQANQPTPQTHRSVRNGKPGGLPQANAPRSKLSQTSHQREDRPVKKRLCKKKKSSAVGVNRAASPKLMRKLTALTHSQQLAERLIANALQNNPGRSVDWAADKVIYDLERDRH